MRLTEPIEAWQIEEQDAIWHNNDQIVISEKVDEGESIMLKGHSWITDENVVYLVTPFTEVYLWTEEDDEG